MGGFCFCGRPKNFHQKSIHWKIMNRCIGKKWIERSPLIGFKISVNETHNTFLNEQELLLIAEKEIAIKNIKNDVQPFCRMDSTKNLFSK